MGAGRRLWMVLDGKNGVLPVPDAFDGSVVEVKVGDLKRLRAGNAGRFAANCESMVLRRDKYLSGRKIPHGMVAATMPVGQLHGFPAHRQAKQLVTEADTEDRKCPIRELPDCIDRVTDRRRVAGTVRQENAVRAEAADLIGACCGRDQSDAATLLHAKPQNI